MSIDSRGRPLLGHTRKKYQCLLTGHDGRMMRDFIRASAVPRAPSPPLLRPIPSPPGATASPSTFAIITSTSATGPFSTAVDTAAAISAAILSPAPAQLSRFAVLLPPEKLALIVQEVKEHSAQSRRYKVDIDAQQPAVTVKSHPTPRRKRGRRRRKAPQSVRVR